MGDEHTREELINASVNVILRLDDRYGWGGVLEPNAESIWCPMELPEDHDPGAAAYELAERIKEHLEVRAMIKAMWVPKLRDRMRIKLGWVRVDQERTHYNAHLRAEIRLRGE
jgi:hypothetical protein